MLQKECQSGKYELQCLAGAKSIQELQLCKKN
jgi:small lipoprotein (TIGR04454 family)